MRTPTTARGWEKVSAGISWFSAVCHVALAGQSISCHHSLVATETNLLLPTWIVVQLGWLFYFKKDFKDPT